MAGTPQGSKAARSGWWLVALALVFVGFLWWQTTQSTAQMQQAAGGVIMQDLQGNAFDMGSLSGKIQIVDFWASWCGPCRMEIPGFIDLHNRYSSQGVEIVGIAMDSGSASDVRQFVEHFGINYRILMGTAAAAEAYGGIEGYPTTLIFDPAGNLVRRYVGYRPKEVFENDIKSLLNL